MNREIEFRAKSVDTGDWVIGNLCWYKTGECYIEERVDEECAFPVDPDTVGQYTGIMDTNGVKVFEGDIVYVNGDDIGVIEYKCGCFYVRCDGYEGTFYDNYFGSDVEVIGNIYENKELLNE